MKKVLTILLAAVMSFSIIFTCFAADTSDLPKMELDELVALRDEINKEIATRHKAELTDVIYAGTYVAGKDIMAGSYNIFCTSDGYLTIYIYDSEESYAKYQSDYKSKEGRLDLLECSMGKTLSVNLKDGQVMHIKRGEGVCSASKPSWAP